MLERFEDIYLNAEQFLLLVRPSLQVDDLSNYQVLLRLILHEIFFAVIAFAKKFDKLVTNRCPLVLLVEDLTKRPFFHRLVQFRKFKRASPEQIYELGDLLVGSTES